jgi:hypothetical protein
VPVKALLESGELILRGDLRRRVPITAMQKVRAEGDTLSFTVNGERVQLTLGSDTAARWAQAIAAPPATLAKKLGITSETTVRMLGPVDDRALEAALAEAKSLNSRQSTLLIARIDTPAGLAAALRKTLAEVTSGVPLWLVYPKGSAPKGHSLTESDVRTAARDIGLIDTKVASVSPTLTALKFIKRNT